MTTKMRRSMRLSTMTTEIDCPLFFHESSSARTLKRPDLRVDTDKKQVRLKTPLQNPLTNRIQMCTIEYRFVAI